MDVALIGYGEVGRILGEDLRAAGQTVTAFDLKLDSDEGERLRAHARAHAVTLAGSHAEAVRSAELVISAVTASQTIAAAEACAPALPAGSFFLDLNSASPGAKMAAAGMVAGGAGRYVDGAVMTAVPPYRLKVPLLLGGPDAAALVPQLLDLGFSAKLASGRLGVASATKMCRSVIIKGMETLFTESLLTARRLGVERDVLDSLQDTIATDWDKLAGYMVMRTLKHGKRRAEELREVARTVAEAHIPPVMASAIAERQDMAWKLGEGVNLDAGLMALLDAVLEKLPEE